MPKPVALFFFGMWHFVYFVVNLSYGLWFLFRHPISFAKFAKEYRRFEIKIDLNDQIADSGYYELNRRERRALAKRARRATNIQLDV